MNDTPYEQQMDRVLEAFERSAAVKESEGEYWYLHRDHLFEKAMHGLFLLGLHRRDITARAWSAFCAQVSAAVGNSRLIWHNYVDTTLEKALHSAVDEWDSWTVACEYRSATQFLLDGGSAFDSPESDWRELLDEADENLRRFGPMLAPPRPQLPEGVPEDHWWWFLPASDDGTGSAAS